jgi:hypothetical protein
MSENELTTGQAFQYMGELIAEYMKTLPIPVRAPVVSMVNQASQVIGNALNEHAALKIQAAVDAAEEAEDKGE